MKNAIYGAIIGAIVGFLIAKMTGFNPLITIIVVATFFAFLCGPFASKTPKTDVREFLDEEGEWPADKAKDDGLRGLRMWSYYPKGYKFKYGHPWLKSEEDKDAERTTDEDA